MMFTLSGVVMPGLYIAGVDSITLEKQDLDAVLREIAIFWSCYPVGS
jgi:hypothetical protein